MGETVGLDHAEDEKEREEGCRDVRGRLSPSPNVEVEGGVRGPASHGTEGFRL